MDGGNFKENEEQRNGGGGERKRMIYNSVSILLLIWPCSR